MQINRRRLLTVAAGSLVADRLSAARAQDTSRPRTRAILFDAFPILDPSPTVILAEDMFPGKGQQLSSAWRARQFEYCWLRTLSGRYTDFWSVTEDALVFAAGSLKLDLSREHRERLMESYLSIKAYPEAAQAITTLRASGIRLGFLSNFTRKMLEAGIKNSGLEGAFEHILSTDDVSAYKPDPRAYRMGVEAFGLKREECVFAAFAGWDVAGAKWFGYPTFWVNRAGQRAEELGTTPDGVGANLNDLVNFVKS